MNNCFIKLFNKVTLALALLMTITFTKINSDAAPITDLNCFNLPSVDVFILAGQSNAQGAGRTQEIASEHWLRNLWSGNGFPFYIRTIGINNSWQTGDHVYHVENFGPELTMAARLQRQRRTPFLIFKAAFGGSILKNLGSTNEWRSRGAGGLYDETIHELQQAFKEVCTAGYYPKIKSFFWMQGESDSGSMEIANDYENNLSRLISELREDLSDPNLPVIIGKIKNGADSMWNYPDIIRLAQSNVAQRIPFVTTVETNDLPVYSAPCTLQNPGYCKAHYSTAGLLTMGERFIDAYNTMTHQNESAEYLIPGFYKLSYDEAIYYVKDSNVVCGFPNWPHFISWGGQPDLSNVNVLNAPPPKIDPQGACSVW